VCACVSKSSPSPVPARPSVGTSIKDSIAWPLTTQDLEGAMAYSEGARNKREGRGAWLGKWKRGLLLSQKGIFVALVAARE